MKSAKKGREIIQKNIAHNFVILKFIANFDYKKEVIFIKKNIIVTNPSKIDVKQKEQDTAKSLCYVIF